MARSWPDLSDVKVTRDVFEEKILRDGVVVGGVPWLELDSWIENRHETATLVVQGVHKGSEGLFRVVDRVEGEVLPPWFFFSGKEREREEKTSERKVEEDENKTLSSLSLFFTCPCSRYRPKLDLSVWEGRKREEEE